MADRPTRVRAAGYDATASLVATMRDTAVDAKDDAETAQAAAESAQSGAASSASAASSSASSAASSASSASSSAAAAEAARDLASEIAIGDADAALAGAILNEASDTYSALTASTAESIAEGDYTPTMTPREAVEWLIDAIGSGLFAPVAEHFVSNHVDLQATVDAAVAGGGGVVVVDVSANIGGARVNIPNGVGIRCINRATVVCTTTGGIDIGTDGVSTSHHEITRLRINGQGTATDPLRIYQVVGAFFQNVQVTSTAPGSTSCLIKGAQNNVFNYCRFLGAGAYSLILDTFTYNNAFLGVELQNATTANLLVRNGSGGLVPRLNKFYGGVIEDAPAVIKITAGASTQFYGTQTAGGAVVIDGSTDGVSDVLLHGMQIRAELQNCIQVNGNDAGSIVTVSVDKCVFETGAYALKITTTDVLVTWGTNTIKSGLTGFYETSSGVTLRNVVKGPTTRVEIPASRLSLGAASPTGISRTFVGGREVIQLADADTGNLVGMLDTKIAGIEDWKTFSVTFNLSAVGNDANAVRLRVKATADDSGLLTALAATGTGAVATLFTMSGVTDTLQASTTTNSLTMPVATTRVAVAVNRNGTDAGDTSTQPVNLHSIVLNRLS